MHACVHILPHPEVRARSCRQWGLGRLHPTGPETFTHLFTALTSPSQFSSNTSICQWDGEISMSCCHGPRYPSQAGWKLFSPKAMGSHCWVATSWRRPISGPWCFQNFGKGSRMHVVHHMMSFDVMLIVCNFAALSPFMAMRDEGSWNGQWWQHQSNHLWFQMDMLATASTPDICTASCQANCTKVTWQ